MAIPSIVNKYKCFKPMCAVCGRPVDRFSYYEDYFDFDADVFTAFCHGEVEEIRVTGWERRWVRHHTDIFPRVMFKDPAVEQRKVVEASAELYPGKVIDFDFHSLSMRGPAPVMPSEPATAIKKALDLNSDGVLKRKVKIMSGVGAGAER